MNCNSRRLFRIGLVAATLVTLLSVPHTTQAADRVTVLLKSGRRMEAVVDGRSDSEKLWLRFERPTIMMLRPILWSRVVSAELNTQPVDKRAMLRLAASDRESRANGKPSDATNESPEPATAPQPPEGDPPRSNPHGSPTDAERASRALGFARVRSVDVDVYAANWDRDVETDGLVVQIRPLDRRGGVQLLGGTLEVTLYSVVHRGFDEVVHGRGTVPTQTARWSRRVTTAQLLETGGSVELPYRGVHPELQTRIESHGLVHVRYSVPGHGVFDRTIDSIRLRPYSPFRDLRQRLGRSRVLPNEQVGTWP